MEKESDALFTYSDDKIGHAAALTSLDKDKLEEQAKKFKKNASDNID